MENLEDRIKHLEEKVAEARGWKDRAMKAEGKIEEIRRAFRLLVPEAALKSDSEAAELPVQERVSLTQREISVQLTYEVVETNMTTKTAVGKVLYCALSPDLDKEGWTENDVAVAMAELGWRMGHSTLAPTLGALVRDGYLVRLPGKPAKYRLPKKLRITVDNREKVE